MHYYLVATATHANSQQSAFTYHSHEQLSLGSIVLVPVGKRCVVGVVIASVKKPTTFTTRSIEKRIEDTPLPKPLIKLASWIVDYYSAHPAAVWQTILPRGLEKNRRKTNSSISYPKRNRTNIVLNKAQRAAITEINAMPQGTALLEGVTGSGKTQVYIELAKESVDNNKSVIVLVPEIALTPQLIAEFSHYFTEVIVTHSTLTEAERHRIWRQCLTTQSPLIIIGPRSALFSPLHNLGLVIIDECHEPSFKQEQSPRYSALRAASVLSGFHNAKLVLGSATPSIADRYLAEVHERPIIDLRQVARPNAQPPKTVVIDMTKREHFTRHRFLSNRLLESLEQTLEAGRQSLVFHNRRGSVPTTLCENCGWTAICPRCFIPLTLHADSYDLRCHICNYTQKVPTSCPMCQKANVIHKGIGTKLIASELERLFPKAKIARFDADTTSTETVEKLYQELYDGTIDIMIGTQVVAKGLDLPNLRTVGIIQADNGLALPDYQASERVFQLIAQVRGRVGRNPHASTIIIQSYQPKHPSVSHGIDQNYEAFYAHTLEERRRANFPPFSYILKLTSVYKTEAGAIRACQQLAQALASKKHTDVTILGPAPAFYERVRDTYRWQLILKSPKREHLISLLSHLPNAKWQADLDPASLL